MENEELNKKILEIWRDHTKERGNYWPVLYPEFTESKILFIGLNPSGDSEQKFELKDVSYLENEEKISSQIELEKKAKETYTKYFKPFQKISESIYGEGNELKFNHLDLFFYRGRSSNDFMSLLEKGELKEFFEKQLEISLEAIKKRDPEIIFVANKNASDILKQKWNDLIDESKFNKEGFDRIIINNKPVPIFFSGMISSARMIDDHSLKRLIWHIKKALDDRKEEEQEILKLLEKLWEKYPNQRLGQLLENYMFKPEKMFYQDDGETMGKIKKELNKK